MRCAQRARAGSAPSDDVKKKNTPGSRIEEEVKLEEGLKEFAVNLEKQDEWDWKKI